MNENKQNTVLLTVIAVATLLVAVIGATFAYFTTANATGSTSSVTVTGGKMVIAFSENSNAVTMAALPTGTNGQPMDGYLPSTTILAQKVISITGTNDTNLNMPFTIDLVYTNSFSDGALLYRVTETTVVTGTDTKDYSLQTATFTADQDAGRAALMLGTNNPAIGGIVNKSAQNNTAVDGRITIASGSFNPMTNGETLTLSLEIWFPDTGESQDIDKQAEFSGYIEVNGNEADNAGSLAA